MVYRYLKKSLPIDDIFCHFIKARLTVRSIVQVLRSFVLLLLICGGFFLKLFKGRFALKKASAPAERITHNSLPKQNKIKQASSHGRVSMGVDVDATEA